MLGLQPLWLLATLATCLTVTDGLVFRETLNEGKKKMCQYNFVVHIGPHKTGSCSVQSFLVKKRAWLQTKFGIYTGNFSHHKAPIALYWDVSRVVHHHRTQSRVAEQIFQDINSRLGKQHIVLSSESFDKFTPAHWKIFKSRLADSGSCMRLVMLHRRESDQMFAYWNQVNKNKTFPASPEPLGSFFLKNIQDFTADYQVRMWDTISAAAPAGAVGVSYEFLKENNYSTTGFIICNATLRLEAASWKQCIASITQEEQTSDFDSERNVSPLHTALDVVRLANGLRHQGGLNCTIDPWSQNVVEVAMQMPVVCGSFDAYFKSGEDAWFKKTSAARPVGPSKESCFVDEPKLTNVHWTLIRNILQKCEA